MLKTVFHVHTDHSDDSNLSPEMLVASARRTGVQCLAVTDHDTTAGACAVREAAAGEFQVIIGEEITTREGHLIGLFLHDTIDPGLSARRTAELIHRQGGVVIAPHPFNRIFGCSLREHVHDLVDLLDAVEVCNAQNLLPFPNRQAAAFARSHDLPAIVGVDIHMSPCLDACFQWLPPFTGPGDFICALRQARLVPGRHSLGYFARCAWHISRSSLGFGFPPGFGRNCPKPRPSFEPEAVPVPE